MKLQQILEARTMDSDFKVYRVDGLSSAPIDEAPYVDDTGVLVAQAWEFTDNKPMAYNDEDGEEVESDKPEFRVTVVAKDYEQLKEFMFDKLSLHEVYAFDNIEDYVEETTDLWNREEILKIASQASGRKRPSP